MKQWLSCSLFVLAASLAGQSSAPICGYPELHNPQGEVTIKRLSLEKSLVADTTFKIRENILAEEINLIEVLFTELYVGVDFVIYGETAEIDAGRIPNGTVDEIAQNFASFTGPGSINDTLGIKALSEQLFGEPPHAGNDQTVYILLIDVRDGYITHESDEFVAGYFDPLDQRAVGNMADIIYIDTNPGMSRGMDPNILLNTLAHEYQHLIHYGRDSDEDVWLNEGLSELAPQLMGIAGRDFSSYLVNTNVILDQFNGRIADYARCGLFLTYYFHRFGIAAISALVEDSRNGISSLKYQLSEAAVPQTIDEFINQWHQANYFGQRAESPYPSFVSIPTPSIHDEILEYPTNLGDKHAMRFGANWTMISGGTELLLRVDRHDPGIDMLVFPGTTSGLTPPKLFTYGFVDAGFGVQYDELYLLTTGTEAIADSGAFSLYTSATGGYTTGLPIAETPLFVTSFYPNPISTAQIKTTGIQIDLFGAHNSVRVTIYDILGRELRTIKGIPAGGLSYLSWRGINDQGMPVPSGVYLARISAGGQSATRKILVVR